MYSCVCSLYRRGWFSWSLNRVVHEWMDLGFILAEMLELWIWRYACGLGDAGLERG